MSVCSTSSLRDWLKEMQLVDRAVYEAVAETPTPRLDVGMRRLSQAANYSRISIAAAVVIAAAGGRRGRRAAVSGMACVAATSATANLVIKPLSRRHRPDRGDPDVPAGRQVTMPRSASFPSGHTAAAVAFASGATRRLRVLGPALYGLAAFVGYSRIHTGVHYPADVVGGAVLGAAVADAVGARIPRCPDC